MFIIDDLIKADKYTKWALENNYDAFTTVESAARKTREEYEKANKSILKLANRKKGIINESFSKFLDIYKKIIKINFKEVGDVYDGKALILKEENIREIKLMISVTGVSMSDKEVIATFLFSWEYGGIFGAIKKDAKINFDLASARVDEADVIAKQNETAQITIKGIRDKAEAFSKLLAQINLLFLKSIKYSEEIIGKNGVDKKYYSDDDRKVLMNCINFAKATKDIVEAPLFDSEGRISQQVNKAMSVGNEYVEKMHRCLS